MSATRSHYDYFGRVTQVLHQDSTHINYAYSNSNTTITDENTGPATLTYTPLATPTKNTS